MSLQPCGNASGSARSLDEILGECGDLCEHEETEKAEQVAKTLPDRTSRERALSIVHCPEYSPTQRNKQLQLLAERLSWPSGQAHDQAVDTLRNVINDLRPCCFRRNNELLIDFTFRYIQSSCLQPFAEIMERGVMSLNKKHSDFTNALLVGRWVAIWCPDMNQNLLLCSEQDFATEWTCEVEGEPPAEMCAENTRKLHLVSKTDNNCVLKEFRGCTVPETFQLLSRLWKGKLVEFANTWKIGPDAFTHLKTVRTATQCQASNPNFKLACDFYQVDSPTVSCIALRYVKINQSEKLEFGECMMKIKGVWFQRHPIRKLATDDPTKLERILLTDEYHDEDYLKVPGDADLLDLTTSPPTFIQKDQTYQVRRIEDPFAQDQVTTRNLGVEFHFDGTTHFHRFKSASPALFLQSETDEMEKQMIATIHKLTQIPPSLCKYIVKMCDLDALTLPQHLLTNKQ